MIKGAERQTQIRSRAVSLMRPRLQHRAEFGLLSSQRNCHRKVEYCIRVTRSNSARI